MKQRSKLNAAFMAGILACAVAFSPGTLPAQGTIEPLLQYQGVLRDKNGDLVSGNVPVTFRLFVSEDPMEEPPIWEERQDLAIKGGLVTAVLGSKTPLDHRYFGAKGLWLGIEVEEEGLLEPLQRLLPSALALYADTAENANNLGGNPPSDFARQSDIEDFVTVTDLAGLASLDVAQTFTASQSIEVPGGNALTTTGSISVSEGNISVPDGNVSANSFNFSEPRTKRLRIQGVDFSPVLPTTTRVLSVDNSLYPGEGSGTTGSNQRFAAPVNLPAGARITEVRMQVIDNVEDNDIEMILMFSRDTTAGQAIFTTFQLNSEGVEGLDWVSMTPQTPLTVFDDRFYFLRLSASGNWAESGFNLRFRLAEIHYEIDGLE